MVLGRFEKVLSHISQLDGASSDTLQRAPEKAIQGIVFDETASDGVIVEKRRRGDKGSRRTAEGRWRQITQPWLEGTFVVAAVAFDVESGQTTALTAAVSRKRQLERVTSDPWPGDVKDFAETLASSSGVHEVQRGVDCLRFGHVVHKGGVVNNRITVLLAHIGSRVQCSLPTGASGAERNPSGDGNRHVGASLRLREVDLLVKVSDVQGAVGSL